MTVPPVPPPTVPTQLSSMYRQIVESGNEGIWVFDLDGRTAHVNLRMAQMLDYSMAEMAALSLLDVLDDEGRGQGAAFLARQRAEGGTTESAECLLLRRGGEAVWTVISHSPWVGADGELLGLIAFVNDITERRRLSDALRRREEQLAEAQRVARLGSWEWDVAADDLSWSDELYLIFGLHRGDFGGTLPAYLDLVHPADRQMTAEVVQACLDGDPTFEFEQRVAVPGRADVIWVRTAGEVLRDESGSAVRMRGTALDITAYKEAEERLRRTTSRQRLLRTVADTANAAETLHEVASTSVREMCTHLGWRMGRVYLVDTTAGCPEPVGDWQLPDQAGATADDPAQLAAVTAGLGSVSDQAVEVIACARPRWSVGDDPATSAESPDGVSDGEPLVSFAVPVMSRDEVVAVLEFVVPPDTDRHEAQDVCSAVTSQLALVAERERTNRELHTARDAALAALRAKSAFLATMSHEIRTPMNGVIGLTELLLACDLDDRQREYVVGVRTAGDALLTIINDILDISKIEAGRLELQITEVEINQVVEEVATLLSRQAHAKGLELITDCAPELTETLRGDPGRLRQVLINLVANAIKFTERGRVVLTARTEASSGPRAEPVAVTFEVVDTGIGIEPIDQRRIFEPFTQVDGSTTRRFGGTGLGLAISSELVASMGGHLRVDSRPGVGSRFTFTIRLARPAEPTAVCDPAPESSVRGSADRDRVLVVEDNAINQLVARGLLDRLGYACDLAGNGVEALQALEGTDYAAVLMDCQMPELDGYAATGELRRREGSRRHTPVIAMTAGALAGDEARCLAAGMDAYVPKPIDSGRLEAVLTRWVATAARS